MNQFQKNIIKKFKHLDINDFIYFTVNTEIKIKQLGLPRRYCDINNIFIDANYAEYHRREYCLKNCGLKCLTK